MDRGHDTRAEADTVRSRWSAMSWALCSARWRSRGVEEAQLRSAHCGGARMKQAWQGGKANEVVTVAEVHNVKGRGLALRRLGTSRKQCPRLQCHGDEAWCGIEGRNGGRGCSSALT